MALKRLLKTPRSWRPGSLAPLAPQANPVGPCASLGLTYWLGYEGLGDAWTVLGSRRCRGFPNSPIRWGARYGGLRERARDRGGGRRPHRGRRDTRRTIR